LVYYALDRNSLGYTALRRWREEQFIRLPQDGVKKQPCV